MTPFQTATSQPNWVPPRLRVTRTEYRPEPVSVGTSPADLLSTPSSQAEFVSPETDYEEVYQIRGALPGGYWLLAPLPVRVRIEIGEYVAEQPHLALHAFGENAIDAIYNLRDELVEHHTGLEEMGDRLSPPLLRQRDLLRRLLFHASA